MQLNGGVSDGMQLRCRREKELVAELHDLLFPSTAPSPADDSMGGSSWSSSLSAGEHCSSPAASFGDGRGSKRVREDERHLKLQEEQKRRGRCSTATKAARSRKKKAEGTTMVTTVPDFDGYQWKKYGQKQIGAAQYQRWYYRCTNNTDQHCSAKRTVQRNDDGDSDGGPPKYTVVYISEHSCKTGEAAVAAPVILETTDKTPDIAAVLPSSSSAISTDTQSPACSDITSVAGLNTTTPSEGADCSSMFAVDGDCWGWDPSPMAPVAAAAVSLQEMDFTGPIMSPVHVVATDESWISDLFVDESPFVLSSSRLFGF